MIIHYRNHQRSSSTLFFEFVVPENKRKKGLQPPPEAVRIPIHYLCLEDFKNYSRKVSSFFQKMEENFLFLNSIKTRDMISINQQGELITLVKGVKKEKTPKKRESEMILGYGCNSLGFWYYIIKKDTFHKVSEPQARLSFTHDIFILGRKSGL